MKFRTQVRSDAQSVVVLKSGWPAFVATLAVGIGAVLLASLPVLQAGGSIGSLSGYVKSLVLVVGGSGVVLVLCALFVVAVAQQFAFDLTSRSLMYSRKYVFGSRAWRRPLEEVNVRMWTITPSADRSFKIDLPKRKDRAPEPDHVIGVKLTLDRGLNVTAMMAREKTSTVERGSRSQVLQIQDLLESAGVVISAGAVASDSVI